MDLFKSTITDLGHGLVFKPWLKDGISHGFGILGTAERISRVQLLNQIHGTRLIHATHDQNDRKADGWLIDCSTASKFWGLKTADCLPIIMRGLGPSRTYYTAVHAGWRGLAAGIQLQAVEWLRSNGAQKIEVVAGPAAEACCYQVGEEVVRALGETVEIRKANGSNYLSMSGSLIRSLRAESDVSVYPCQLCTICNLQFSSHRRSKGGEARDLAFVLS